jgi:hypothetical protein
MTIARCPAGVSTAVTAVVPHKAALALARQVPKWVYEGNINSLVLERRNGPLIAQVAKLWIKPQDLVLDVTFGRGNFWTHYEPQFFLTHDLKYDGVDFRELPEDAGSIDVVVLDPPYVSPGGRKTSTIPSFNDAYGLTDSPRTPIESAILMILGMAEGDRVLRPGGRMLVKCCNYITSGKFFDAHYLVTEAARKMGLMKVDEFIHGAGPGPQPKFNLDGSLRRQVHSRRVHSFLLVFEKGKISG